MRVLVTGSSGRIGSAVVTRLLENGHRVRGFDVRPTDRQAADHDEITGSLDDPAAAERACAGADAILHLGALMSWALADRAAMFRANVEGTRVLLDKAAAAGASRFVFASSGEVYPENAPSFLPLTEAHPLTPNSAYGLTKLLGEELVRFHGRAGHLEPVILRFSHTQDAAELLDEDSFFSGPRFFLRPRIRQQEAFGNRATAARLRAADPGCPAHLLARDGSGRATRMHITETRDMVAGLVLALEHPDAAGQTFNLGATDPVDFEPLLSAMARITGYPVVTVDFPGNGVYYRTSNEKICKTLGYRPEWTIEQMLDAAARARRARSLG